MEFLKLAGSITMLILIGILVFVVVSGVGMCLVGAGTMFILNINLTPMQAWLCFVGGAATIFSVVCFILAVCTFSKKRVK